jgi:hypothetical protein
MNEPDGVPCEPGSMIRSDNGTWWVCGEEGKVYEPLLVPKCTEGQVLVYGKEGFVCRELEHGNTLALWVMGAGLALTIFGILGMGARQWWMDWKKRKKEAVKWEDLLASPGQILPGNVVLDTSKPWPPGPMTTCIPGTDTHINCKHTSESLIAEEFQKMDAIIASIPTAKEPVMTEPVKPVVSNVDAIQKEIAQIMMEIQMGRGELNKIPGMVQVYVNGAMNHFNEAVKKLSALGGMVK